MNWQPFNGVFSVFCFSLSRVNQNYQDADSTRQVPAGLNEPKNAFSLAELTSDEYGVVYDMVTSKDVHFNLLCVFVSEWNCCLCPSFT